MLNFLRGASAPEIVAVCVIVRKISDYTVATGGTKEQLLHGLRGVGDVLFEAIDAVFPNDDCEDDDGDEEEAESCEKEYCEENDLEHEDED